MIRKEITYIDYIGGAEQEVTETLRFAYTLAAVKMYEHETGNRFFVDYNAALAEFSSSISGKNIADINDMDEADQLAFMPILSNPKINEFMMGFIPCMYAEAHDGVLLQSEETHDNALNAAWMMLLVNLEFFFEIFAELNASAIPTRKTSKKNTARKQG